MSGRAPAPAAASKPSSSFRDADCNTAGDVKVDQNMVRKLDARAATFSPSIGAPPQPQQLQQQQQQSGSLVGAGASSAASAGSAVGPTGAAGHNTQGSRAKHQGRSTASKERSSSAKRSAPRGGGSAGDDSHRRSGRGSRRERRASEGSASRGGVAAVGDGDKGGGTGGTSDSGETGHVQHRREGAAQPVAPGSAHGKGRKKNNGAGNANHLLNFQFQPVSSSQQGADSGARGRRGLGGGGGGGSGRKGGGVWGGGSSRGPMSKEQFLQANFHFLLQNPAWTIGRSSLAPPVLQEAFFDPDVLVDWDTVNTVRLFRKVSRRKEAVSSRAQEETASSARGTSQTDETPKKDQSERDASNSAAVSPATQPDIHADNALWVTYKSVGKKASSDVDDTAWGSAKRRSTSPQESATDRASGRGQTADATDTGSRLVDDGRMKHADVAKQPDPSAARRSGISDADSFRVDGVDGHEDMEGDADDDEWRCPICLEPPIVPRVTKCGHGPFCLVCILRHLKGESSARCPLCFDKMSRDQLRRAVCEHVRPYAAGGKASLVLLQRERTSLVPHAFVRGDTAGGIDKEGTNSVLPRDVEDGDDGGWASGACPKQGDESERFSRLVTAGPRSLLDLSASEKLDLTRFRHESLATGETEWIPFVSQAQGLVNMELEHFATATAAAAAASTKRRKDPRLQPPADVVSGDQRHASPRQEDSRQDVMDGVAARVRGDAAREGAEGKDNDSGVADTSSGVSSSAHDGYGPGGAFRFLQSCDGQKAFLHPLDMRQLLDDLQKGLELPQRIDAEVLEVETVKLTPELRRRLPFLGHLPIHCDISFLEVDMIGLVSEETASKFREETQKRERKRRTRAAQERRAAAKDARDEDRRTARIAAMRAFTVDLEGPKPGILEPVPPPAHATASASHGRNGSATGSDIGYERSPAAVENVSDGQAMVEDGIALLRLRPTEGGVSSGQDSAPSGGGDTGSGGSSSDASGNVGANTGAGWSFARITAMNGHFPSLNSTGSSSPPDNPGVEPVGAAPRTTSSMPRNLGIEGTREARGVTGAWGSQTVEVSSQRRGEDVGAGPSWGGASARVDAIVSGDGDVSEPGSGKKKGRKGKAVSLFSNAGVRGGR